MPDEQKVSASDILKAAGADKPVTEGTFLQRTGLILAGCVGGVAAVVILALVGKWIFYAPTLPVQDYSIGREWRQPAHRCRSRPDAAERASRRPRSYRRQVWLRRGAMRRVYRSHRRPARQIVPHQGWHGGRQTNRHH